MSDLFNPPAIIRKYQAENSSASVELKQSAMVHQTTEDVLRHKLFYGSIKLRGTDGRTYDYYEKETGEYISSYLSPYNKNILNNVEPGIVDVVEELLSKGYLTWGSCQGHPSDGMNRRWVGLAFISEEERAKFIKLVSSFNLPVYWYFNFLKFNKRPEKREGMTIGINPNNRYKDRAEQLRGSYTEEDLTEWWNLTFARNYKKYYPVMMFISSCQGDITFLSKLKILYQWPFRDLHTAKLASKLKNNLEVYQW